MFYLTLFILFFSGSALAAVNSTPKVLSVTVAQVGGKVMTSREVMISYLIDQWELYTVRETDSEKTRQKANRDKISELPLLGSEVFKKQLAIVQLEYLVLLEAENFSIGEVTVEEVKKKAAFISEGLKDWSSWKSLDVSIVEVEGILSRKIRAKNFIKYKSESMGIQITETEIKDYYDANRVKFGNFSLEKMKENIREHLNQRNIEIKMKDWVAILKKKYSVRNLQYEELIK